MFAVRFESAFNCKEDKYLSRFSKVQPKPIKWVFHRFGFCQIFWLFQVLSVFLMYDNILLRTY